MTVHPFADRLSKLLATAPRHLERVPAVSVDDGLLWMRDWHDIQGRHPWMGASDAQRRRAVKWWLFLRWRHAAEWRQRGGGDAT